MILLIATRPCTIIFRISELVTKAKIDNSVNETDTLCNSFKFLLPFVNYCIHYVTVVCYDSSLCDGGVLC